MSDDNNNNGWVKLYHPSGALVTLSVPMDSESNVDYAVAFAAVGRALAAGFLVTAPGLEAGEMKDTVGWVGRGQHQGRSGMADMLFLFSIQDWWVKKFLVVYLNTDDQRLAFEAASGMVLASIPLYEGNGYPERGKQDKFIAAAPRPFGVVFKPNPKYDEAKAKAATQANPYTVAKKVFVRWDGGFESTTPSKPDDGTMPDLVAKWKTWLASDPNLETFNKEMGEVFRGLTKSEKSAVWPWVKDHVSKTLWVYDKETQAWKMGELP